MSCVVVPKSQNNPLIFKKFLSALLIISHFFTFSPVKAMEKEEKTHVALRVNDVGPDDPFDYQRAPDGAGALLPENTEEACCPTLRQRVHSLWQNISPEVQRALISAVSSCMVHIGFSAPIVQNPDVLWEGPMVSGFGALNSLIGELPFWPQMPSLRSSTGIGILTGLYTSSLGVVRSLYQSGKLFELPLWCLEETPHLPGWASYAHFSAVIDGVMGGILIVVIKGGEYGTKKAMEELSATLRRRGVHIANCRWPQQHWLVEVGTTATLTAIQSTGVAALIGKYTLRTTAPSIIVGCMTLVWANVLGCCYAKRCIPEQESDEIKRKGGVTAVIVAGCFIVTSTIAALWWGLCGT